MRHLRQLLNDSVIYGLGGAFSKSIALLTLPILTRIFSPKDFGEIEMLSVIGSLLAAGLNLGLDSAQSKFFFKEKAWIFLLILSLKKHTVPAWPLQKIKKHEYIC